MNRNTHETDDVRVVETPKKLEFLDIHCQKPKGVNSHPTPGKGLK